MYRKPLDTLLVGKKNYVSRGFLYIYYTHLLKITEIVSLETITGSKQQDRNVLLQPWDSFSLFIRAQGSQQNRTWNFRSRQISTPKSLFRSCFPFEIASSSDRNTQISHDTGKKSKTTTIATTTTTKNSNLSRNSRKI